MVRFIINNQVYDVKVDDFTRAITLLKESGGRFDPATKTWKLEYLTPSLYALLSKHLNANELEKLKSLVYDAIPSGNYYIVDPTAAGKIDYNALKYIRRKFDPNLRKYVDVEVKLYIVKPSGFVLVPRGLVVNALKNINYKPFKPDFNVQLSADKYRPYQVDALKDAINYLRSQGAVTLMIATGGGKSYMSAGFARDALASGAVKKIYYLAPSLDLVNQFAEFARKWGLDVGVVSGEEKDWDKPVVAATVQTLYRTITSITNEEEEEEKEEVEEETKAYLDEVELTRDERRKLYNDYVNNADLVIIDEVQHLPANTVKAVVKSNPSALRIGLSATPFRNDGRDLEIYAFAGSIADRKISASELIKEGYLVPPYIIMWRRPIKCNGDNFNAIKKCVFSNEERNKDIIELAKVMPKPLLILTKEVAPAKKLYELARQAGLNAELVIGAVKGSKRVEIFDKVRNGEVDVLIADTLADEGLDLPSLRSLLITSGGKSKTRTLQRVGRVIRPWMDKKLAIVVDIWDGTDYFNDHALERKELYKTEKLWDVEEVNGNVNDVIKRINELINELGMETSPKAQVQVQVQPQVQAQAQASPLIQPAQKEQVQLVQAQGQQESPVPSSPPPPPMPLPSPPQVQQSTQQSQTQGGQGINGFMKLYLLIKRLPPPSVAGKDANKLRRSIYNMSRNYFIHSKDGLWLGINDEARDVSMKLGDVVGNFLTSHGIKGDYGVYAIPIYVTPRAAELLLGPIAKQLETRITTTSGRLQQGGARRSTVRRLEYELKRLETNLSLLRNLLTSGAVEGSEVVSGTEGGRENTERIAIAINQ